MTPVASLVCWLRVQMPMTTPKASLILICHGDREQGHDGRVCQRRCSPPDSLGNGPVPPSAPSFIPNLVRPAIFASLLSLSPPLQGNGLAQYSDGAIVPARCLCKYALPSRTIDRAQAPPATRVLCPRLSAH